MEEKNNDYKIQETKKSHFTDIFGLFQTLCYWSPHKDKDCEKVHLNFPLSLFIIMRVAFRSGLMQILLISTCVAFF